MAAANSTDISSSSNRAEDGRSVNPSIHPHHKLLLCMKYVHACVCVYTRVCTFPRINKYPCQGCSRRSDGGVEVLAKPHARQVECCVHLHTRMHARRHDAPTHPRNHATMRARMHARTYPTHCAHYTHCTRRTRPMRPHVHTHRLASFACQHRTRADTRMQALQISPSYVQCISTEVNAFPPIHACVHPCARRPCLAE